MRVRDALYGEFDTPSFLEGLLNAPEFRRLSEVRLININSSTLPALSDTRRYSHTLGVLRLALLNPLLGLDEADLRALMASIIVHDVGTPAFAHLFEYLLKERFSWDHESMAAELVDSSGRNTVLQIFESQTPQFQRLCEIANIDFGLVMQFLRKEHPFSRLIFGTVDFDNLDNVARMAWMMGFRFDVARIESLASQLSVVGTTLGLPKSSASDVELWANLRRQAYQVLVFDPPTVAAQAVLSHIMDRAIQDGSLEREDWHYDDHSLLAALGRAPSAKQALARDYYKDLPRLVMIHQESNEQEALWRRGRRELTARIAEFLRERFGARGAVYGYVFRDRGTFSKRLVFVDPTHGDEWSIGSTSDSLVLYGFAKGAQGAGLSPRAVGEEFRNWLERL